MKGKNMQPWAEKLLWTLAAVFIVASMLIMANKYVTMRNRAMAAEEALARANEEVEYYKQAADRAIDDARVRIEEVSSAAEKRIKEFEAEMNKRQAKKTRKGRK